MASFSSLPNELLAHILSIGFSSEFDLPYLWCTLRKVNHKFRYLVEDLVARLHLRNTYITYTLPFPRSQVYIETHHVKFWLNFDGCVPDQPDVAIFRSDMYINADPYDKVWLKQLLKRLEDAKANEFLSPAHMLSCNRYVNDTELCGFEIVVTDDISLGMWEVRIDWKATLSKLLAEEMSRQMLSREFVKEQRSRRVEMDEKDIQGARRAMRLHLLSQRRTRDESFQHARRKRIAAQCAQSGLDFEEIIQTDRERMLLMRKKADELEDHQSSMNQFRFV